LTSQSSAARVSFPEGQNQPMSAIVTGTEPQISAQGVKIDPMKSTVTASALNSGQIDGLGSVVM